MKKLLGLLSASLLILFLAACDGGDSSEGDSTKSSTSSGSESSTPLTEDNFFEVISAAQSKIDSARVEVAMSVAGQEVTMSGVTKTAAETKDMAMDMTMKASLAGTEQEMHMILVDGVFYVNLGDASGGKYVAFDADDEDNPMGAQIVQMRDSGDLASQLEGIEEAVKSVEKVGDGGKIDGVNTTEFLVLIDAAKLDQSAAAAEMPETVEYRMWVGEDNLIRKMAIDVAGVTTEMSWTEWGKDIDISAPLADEITDDASLLNS